MSNAQGLRLLYCPSLLIFRALFCKFPNSSYRKQLEPWKRAAGSLRRVQSQMWRFLPGGGSLEADSGESLIYMKWASAVAPGVSSPLSCPLTTGVSGYTPRQTQSCSLETENRFPHISAGKPDDNLLLSFENWKWSLKMQLNFRSVMTAFMDEVSFLCLNGESGFLRWIFSWWRCREDHWNDNKGFSILHKLSSWSRGRMCQDWI